MLKNEKLVIKINSNVRQFNMRQPIKLEKLKNLKTYDLLTNQNISFSIFVSIMSVCVFHFVYLFSKIKD